MDITRIGRACKGLLVSLIVVPTSVPGQVVAQIKREVRQGQVVVVLQRSAWLQVAEQRCLAVDVGDAVNHQRGHSPLASFSGGAFWFGGRSDRDSVGRVAILKRSECTSAPDSGEP